MSSCQLRPQCQWPSPRVWSYPWQAAIHMSGDGLLDRPAWRYECGSGGFWLVVDLPLWKIWLRQWEGWHPIIPYMKWKKKMFQPPTRYIIYIYISSIHERRNYANASLLHNFIYIRPHVNLWTQLLVDKIDKFKKHTTPEDIITIPWNQVSTAADMDFLSTNHRYWAAGTPACQMVRKNIKWSLLMVRKKPHPILSIPSEVGSTNINPT